MTQNGEAKPGGPARVEGSGATLLEHHAFLLRWGTSKEIGERIGELQRILSWWGSKGVPAEEDEAGGALDTALKRLTHVLEAAKAVELALNEGGYEFDGHLRVLRGRRPGVDDDGPGERARTLLSETIIGIFEHLKQQGRPDENTRELRNEIRASLGRSLHPELLSDRAIETAVDEGTARATDPSAPARP